jgi:hypothetical protein
MDNLMTKLSKMQELQKKASSFIDSIDKQLDTPTKRFMLIGALFLFFCPPIINNVSLIIIKESFITAEKAKNWAGVDILILTVFLAIGLFSKKISIDQNSKLDAVLIIPLLTIIAIAIWGEVYLYFTLPFIWLSFYSISKHTYIFIKEQLLSTFAITPPHSTSLSKPTKEETDKDKYDYIYEWEQISTSKNDGIKGYEYEYEHTKSSSGKFGIIESFFFWITPLFLFMYYLNFKANIYLSNLFYVDPKHFSNTLIVVMGIISLPLLQLGFSCLLLISAVRLIFAKSNSESLKIFSWLIALLFAVIISSTITASPQLSKKIVMSIANTVDFNPSHICKNAFKTVASDKNNVGVIYLNPLYNEVLVYSELGYLDDENRVIGEKVTIGDENDKKKINQLKITNCETITMVNSNNGYAQAPIHENNVQILHFAETEAEAEAEAEAEENENKLLKKPLSIKKSDNLIEEHGS